MSFTAIIGPMKSGKSLELIARLAPYQYTDLHILFVQSAKHVRDSGVQSRAGVQADAKHVSTLREIGDDFDIIAIDEFHMFDDPGDIHTLSAWLQSGKSVYVAGLDVDYRPSSRVVGLDPHAPLLRMTDGSEIAFERLAQAASRELVRNAEPVEVEIEDQGVDAAAREDRAAIGERKARIRIDDAADLAVGDEGGSRQAGHHGVGIAERDQLHVRIPGESLCGGARHVLHKLLEVQGHPALTGLAASLPSR